MNKLARWLPALAVPVVIVGAAIAVPAIASAEAPLPSKSPQQVLALIAKSESAAYAGTVQQASDLGLPDLSALENQQGQGGGSGDDILDLLTASHTAKVYTNGGTKQRVQLLDTLAERDVVRNGNSVWVYDSSAKQATHVTLSGADSGTKTRAPETTPAQLAARLVAQLKPTTSFDVGRSDRVAGRATYRLTLTPTVAGTLVHRATVAVDAKTGVPLDVAVYANGQSKPAVSVAFSAISYGKPHASVFEFTPPKGTDVTTRDVAPKKPMTATPGPVVPRLPATAKPTVTGSGWTAIAELPAGSLDPSKLTAAGSTAGTGSGALPGGADSAAVLGLLQSVPGGRGVQTSLVSVLLTDDGRVLAGAVPLTALESAAR